MCSRVVRSSKNANQIAVSHPFDTCDDSQLFKSLPSMHANVSVPTTTEGWVEKKKKTLALFVHYYRCAFTSETNPSGLL